MQISSSVEKCFQRSSGGLGGVHFPAGLLCLHHLPSFRNLHFHVFQVDKIFYTRPHLHAISDASAQSY